MKTRSLKWVGRICIPIGVLLLGFGVFEFIQIALYRRGSLARVFLGLMGCLGFFNLPAVVQRLIDQKNREQNSERPHGSQADASQNRES